jgi:hypothetical protein
MTQLSCRGRARELAVPESADAAPVSYSDLFDVCGGLGVVYRGFDLALKRWAAVKRVLAGGYDGPKEGKLEQNLGKNIDLNDPHTQQLLRELGKRMWISSWARAASQAIPST